MDAYLPFPLTALEQQIQKVRELRATMESRTQELHELQVVFNQQHKDLIEAKCEASFDCAQEEARLREMTLAAYQETGSKKPAQGVGIRVTKVLSYDPRTAKEWAMIYGHDNLLDLNRSRFADAAKALALDFVRIDDEPQATIAREL
jgi:hypothetical protein